MASPLVETDAPAWVRDALAGRDVRVLVRGRRRPFQGGIAYLPAVGALILGLALLADTYATPVPERIRRGLLVTPLALLGLAAWLARGAHRAMGKPAWFAATPEGLVILVDDAWEEIPWPRLRPDAKVRETRPGRGDVSFAAELAQGEPSRFYRGEPGNRISLADVASPLAVARECLGLMQPMSPTPLAPLPPETPAHVRRLWGDAPAAHVGRLAPTRGSWHTLAACAVLGFLLLPLGFFSLMLITYALGLVPTWVRTSGDPAPATIAVLLVTTLLTVAFLLSLPRLAFLWRGSHAVLAAEGVAFVEGREATMLGWGRLAPEVTTRARSVALMRYAPDMRRQSRILPERCVLRRVRDPEAVAAYARARIDEAPPAQPVVGRW